MEVFESSDEEFSSEPDELELSVIELSTDPTGALVELLLLFSVELFKSTWFGVVTFCFFVSFFFLGMVAVFTTSLDEPVCITSEADNCTLLPPFFFLLAAFLATLDDISESLWYLLFLVTIDCSVYTFGIL